MPEWKLRMLETTKSAVVLMAELDLRMLETPKVCSSSNGRVGLEDVGDTESLQQF